MINLRYHSQFGENNGNNKFQLKFLQQIIRVYLNISENILAVKRS